MARIEPSPVLDEHMAMHSTMPDEAALWRHLLMHGPTLPKLKRPGASASAPMPAIRQAETDHGWLIRAGRGRAHLYIDGGPACGVVLSTAQWKVRDRRGRKKVCRACKRHRESLPVRHGQQADMASSEA